MYSNFYDTEFDTYTHTYTYHFILFYLFAHINPHENAIRTEVKKKYYIALTHSSPLIQNGICYYPIDFILLLQNIITFIIRQ